MAKTMTVTDAQIGSFRIIRGKMVDGVVRWFMYATVQFVDANGVVLYEKEYKKEVNNQTMLNGLDTVAGNMLSRAKADEGV